MLGGVQSWQTPKVEYVAPTHASQPVRAPFGPVPAAHAVQLVRSLLITLGSEHSEQTIPNAEKLVPTQSSHPSRATFGPVPGPHGEQLVRSALMTLGIAHSMHSIPNAE